MGDYTQDHSDPDFFPIDGEIVKYLPKAGAPLKHPSVEHPVLEQDEDGTWYLRLRIQEEPGQHIEPEITRRIPLDNLSAEDWDNLRSYYKNLDFQKIIDQGISHGLEQIDDTKIQRMFLSLLTFLNPRQVAILIYLYRAAHLQRHGPSVQFDSNELLLSLGYTRDKDGSYPSESRAQINRDLVSMHRIELVFPDPEQDQTAEKIRFLVRNILKIESFTVNRKTRIFDWEKAADYTYQLADTYSVSLGFFNTIKRGSDYLLLSTNIDLRQRDSLQTSRDYKSKLRTYLFSRMQWDNLRDGQHLLISRVYLFKYLGLYGTNTSRNSQILWNAINEVKAEGWVVDVKEVARQRGQVSFQFTINQKMLKKKN